ncbi:MAG: ribulose-phosphate 3-epimerase [Bacteroidetes bacterium]|nr:ribulose-phosphate 3-epimerase [Bacteroidota bacterium]
MNKLIAPSLIAADFSNLSQQIRLVEIGGAHMIHCDIMDGNFVPNITFGPLVVESVRKITKLPIDVHLMIRNPDNFIFEFAKAGADYISVHQEEVKHLDRTINLIKDQNSKAGVVLNPATPISTLKNIFSILDFVLIMSVNPGFGGQQFIPYTLEKIRELDKIRAEKGYKFRIEVDGGIGKSNIEKISSAGCDIFIAGSSIFRSGNISAATVELNNLVNPSNN